tara:strand:+ start:317 stop:751 length:435 start_codon:yes stop_codon:yes gene_type:complete
MAQKIKGVNKHGIKLEDYSDYKSYKAACFKEGFIKGDYPSQTPRVKALWGRDRIAKRKQRFFNLYILKKGCPDCGVKHSNMAVYEFDHTDGSKGSSRLMPNIRHAYKSSLKRLFKELRTGEYICANCHNIRTHKRGQHSDRKYS